MEILVVCFSSNWVDWLEAVVSRASEDRTCSHMKVIFARNIGQACKFIKEKHPDWIIVVKATVRQTDEHKILAESKEALGDGKVSSVLSIDDAVNLLTK